MLRTKYRLFILLAIAGTIAGASLVNQIAVYLNINPQDPLLFDTQYYARFNYNNGTNDRVLSLTVAQLGSPWSNVSIQVDLTETWHSITPEGFYDTTNRYTLFWVHVPNPLTSGTEFGITVGTSFNMTDPIGLIGPAGSNYTGIVTDKFVVWPTESGIDGLHGAQFSFQITFYNISNNAVIAQGVYDSTCGMLFSLDGGSPFIQVELVSTDYPISRNRMMSWPWALGLSAGITVLAFFFMKKKTELESETIKEITILMAAGVAAIMVDIYFDVWLYAMFGFMGSMLLHIGVAIGLAAICFYQKYKLKWIIPAILEVAFIIPMVFAMGDPYVPLMTASMGLVITWLIMVYMAGYPKQPESATKLGKLISEFI